MGSEVQPKEGVATGVVHPQPDEAREVPEATATTEEPMKAGVNIGVARPRPSED
jgi:hypothetical protein